MQTLSANPIEESLQLLREHDPRHPSERHALERLWHTGRLQRHLNSLERFYHENQTEFRVLFMKQQAQLSLVELAKLFVIENTIVDRIAETFDQLKEIESEIWIQGEQGNFDREAIALDWAANHAKIWREWRLKEYLFTVEQMQHRLPHCLAIDSGPDQPQS